MIAGPGKRGAARIIDGLIQVMGVAVLVIGVSIADPSPAQREVATGFILVFCFAVFTIYGAFFEVTLRGQTPGKKATNLRVVRSNGTEVGWFEALGRNLLLGVDGMVFWTLPFALFGLTELSAIPLCTLGLLSMFATGRLQRLGDLVFDTMVIDESRAFSGRQPGVTNGVATIPPAQCRARFSVPERTIGVIERLFESNRLISDSRREEIARHLSVTLREWLGWDPPPPDPKNPNSFFVNAPVQHTEFLKRVLVTFGDGPDRKRGGENPAPVQRPEMATDSRRRNDQRIHVMPPETAESPSLTDSDDLVSESLPEDWRKPS